MNSLALDRIDGTHAEAIKDTVDAIQLTPDSGEWSGNAKQ